MKKGKGEKKKECVTAMSKCLFRVMKRMALGF